MLYSSDLRLLSRAGALCRLTLRAPLGSPSWAAVESGDFTAAASFVQRYGRWYSCLQLYTNLNPEDTVTLKRGLSSWQLCDPLLGATSFILSFLWSQQPSPPRAAGDLGPNRSGAPGTSPPPPVLVSGAGVDLLLGAMGHLQGVRWATAGGGGCRATWGDTLPFLPGTPGGGCWTSPTTPSLQRTLHPACWDAPSRLFRSPHTPSQSPRYITGEKVQTSVPRFKGTNKGGPEQEKARLPQVGPERCLCPVPPGALPGPRTSSGTFSPSEAVRHRPGLEQRGCRNPETGSGGED